MINILLTLLKRTVRPVSCTSAISTTVKAIVTLKYKKRSVKSRLIKTITRAPLAQLKPVTPPYHNEEGLDFTVDLKKKKKTLV